MKKFLKVVGILFAILVALIVLAVALSDGNNTNANTGDSSPTSTQTTPTEPPMAVNAKDLVADYEGNEVAADQKYKGKMLEVSGTVASIQSGIGDGAIVQLIGTNEFQTANAQGDKDFTQYAGTLKKGQKITIICKSDGEVIGFPQLSQCKAK